MFDYWKRVSVGLLTDLYQLTMAAGYYANGRHDMWACFHLFFRTAPFKDDKAVAAGLEIALDYLRNIKFTEEDIAYLGTIEGNDGKPIFNQDFLNELRHFKLRLTVDAIPEGTVVFAHEPLLRISGPLWQCQLVETALLTILNFNTLIATKASRITRAAGQDGYVFDFGLRRAQGPDGAISAARAAFIGGCVGTSNVAAGRVWGIPVKGTHAHSWVMSYPSEMEAFEAYARALPNNGVYLVDTYDPIQGIKNAITTFKALEQLGYQGVGIRLDSGDLCTLSITAREMLDDAGLEYIRIFASDSLNEHKIEELNARGAQIDTWGVGTNLITAQDQQALNGVYKIGAILYPATGLQFCMKLSATPAKSTNPGILNIVRCYDPGRRFVADIIVDDAHSVFPEIPATWNLEDIPSVPGEAHQRISERTTSHEPLMVRVVTRGEIVYESPALRCIQEHCGSQLKIHARSVTGYVCDDVTGLPVHLHTNIADLKQELMQSLKGEPQ